MLTARIGTLAALLLLLPTAAACNLGDGTPGPGVFEIRDLETGTSQRVHVDARDLAADCSLGNHHTLDGPWFAWVEPHSEGQRVHAHNLATGDRQALPLPQNRSYGLHLTGDLLIHTSWTRPGEDRIVGAINLTTGQPETLPAEIQATERLSFAGPFILLHDPTSGEFSAYDPQTHTWRFRDTRVSDLGVPDTLTPLHASPRWLLFTGGHTTWVYHLDADTAHNVTRIHPDTAIYTLDGDHAYRIQHKHDDRGRHTILHRTHLPDGNPETLGRYPWQTQPTVNDGRVVIGYYENPDAGILERLLPLETLAPLASLIAGAVALTRPQSRCDRPPADSPSSPDPSSARPPHT